MKKGATHEAFVAAVRKLAAARIEDEARRTQVLSAKLVYGVGSIRGARGVTYFGAWQNGQPQPVDVMEVCATGEESVIQLTGTTVHEAAHVLAGPGCGHGPEWKQACAALGLTTAEAGGQAYKETDFDPELWSAVETLSKPADGKPIFGSGRGAGSVGFPTRKPRPCSLGIGTRGGKSRGAGSGSRLRLWQCSCPKPVKVRVASDTFAAHCDLCQQAFVQVEAVRS